MPLNRKVDSKVYKSPPWMRLGLRTDLTLHALFYKHALRVHAHPYRYIAAVSVLALVLIFGAGGGRTSFRGLSPTYVDQSAGFVRKIQTFGLHQFVDIVVTHRDNAPIVKNGRYEAVKPTRNVFNEGGFAALRRVQSLIEASSVPATADAPAMSYATACLPKVPKALLDVRANRIARVQAAGEACSVHTPGWTLQEATRTRIARGARVVGPGDGVPLHQSLAGAVLDSNHSVVHADAIRVVWDLQPAVDNSDVKYQAAQSQVEQLQVVIRDRLVAASGSLGEYVALVFFPRPLVEPSTVPLLIAMAMLAGLMLFAGSSVRRGVAGFGLSALAGLLCAFVSALATQNLYILMFGLPSQLGLSFFFVAILVGVDDVLVLLFAVRKAKGQSAAQRLATGVGESATAIFMTTATDVAVFAAGSYGAPPAGTMFCTLCVLALVIDFVFQMTFFVAVLSLELRRNERKYDLNDDVEEGGRMCCWKTKKAAEVTEPTTETGNDSTFTMEESGVELASRAKERGDMLVEAGGTAPTEATTPAMSRGPSTRRVSVSSSEASWRVEPRYAVERSKGGRMRHNTLQGLSRSSSASYSSMHAQEVPSPLGRTMRFFLAPLFTSKVVMTVCAVLSLGLVALAAYGATGPWQTAMGFADVGRDAGPRRAWRVEQLQAFPRASTELTVLLPDKMAYEHTVAQNEVLALCRGLDAIDSTWRSDGVPHRCWMEEYATATNGSLPVTQGAFLQGLRALNTSAARHDVLWDGADNIVQTRIVVHVRRPRTSAEAQQLEASVRSALGSRVAYQLALIELADVRNEAQLVASLQIAGVLAVILVGLISALLLINPWSSLVVVASMLVSLGCVLGGLHVVEYQFSVYTYVALVIAFGIGMDQTAHLVLTFNTTSGSSTKRRLESALGSVGPGVWYSGLSNLCIGVLLPFFDGNGATVITLLFAVSLFGWLFSWVTVPLVVQLIGFPPALRDTQMESELQAKRTKLDALWETHFAENEE